MIRILVIISICISLLGGCGKSGEEKNAENTSGGDNLTTPAPPPPIAYEVGSGFPKFEDIGKSKQVLLNIIVMPGTDAEQLRNLLEYINVYKYKEYDTLIVNVYDSKEAADRPGLDQSVIRATMRVTRPRKPVINIIGGEIDEDKILNSAVTNQEKASVYLGEKGRLFSSKDQAAWLIKIIKEKPGHAFYEITWKAVGNVKLTYSVEQKLLVRDTEGVCRETWAGMTLENLQQAAKGGGYRGRDFPNTSYSRVPYQPGETQELDEKKGQPRKSTEPTPNIPPQTVH